MANNTRTRADLAKALYRNIGLSLSESNQLVTEVFEIITQALEKGETVRLIPLRRATPFPLGCRSV